MFNLYLAKQTTLPAITRVIEECLHLLGFDCDVVDFGSGMHMEYLRANNPKKQLCSISSSKVGSNLFEQYIYFFELPREISSSGLAKMVSEKLGITVGLSLPKDSVRLEVDVFSKDGETFKVSAEDGGELHFSVC